MRIFYSLVLLATTVLAASELQGKPFLSAADSMFGNTIEGTGVDSAGNIYAVDFNDSIVSAGQLTGKQALLYKSTNSGSLVSSMRFYISSDGNEEAFVTDAMLHQVVRLYDRDATTGAFASNEVFCQDASMLEPNDIAIAPSTGRIFLSGMVWNTETVAGDGDLWTCDSTGKAQSLGKFMRTNGIEVSPDEKTLYLSESKNSNDEPISNIILAFDLDAASGQISNKRIFVDFEALDKTGNIDVDGMRTDTEGNLYVTRNGQGKVAVFSPDGQLTAYISTPSMTDVANLEFGGASGTDLYMVGKCSSTEAKGCVDVYSGSAVGNAFAVLQKGTPAKNTNNSGPSVSSAVANNTPSQTTMSKASPSSITSKKRKGNCASRLAN